MTNNRHEKLEISNDLLDPMLVGVKTQDDLWGKDGIITQINKALLKRILNAEIFISMTLWPDASLVIAATATAKKLSRAISGN